MTVVKEKVIIPFRSNNHLDFKTTNDDHREKTPQNKKLKSGENQCFRCGMNDH